MNLSKNRTILRYIKIIYGEYEVYTRLLELPKKHNFFLFGARNTGKSTLIESIFDIRTTLFIDLLDYEEETKYANNPNVLVEVVNALSEKVTHIVIDEIQKVPKLLDIVQMLMRKTNKIFVLTGSSARKLKQGGANLLAGRAYVYDLFPLTHIELKDDFDLEAALCWGTLPEVILSRTDGERREFLNAYAHTYLKEEIWGEQHVRKLDPFRKFLEIASQCNGKIINAANIARDVGVDNKTVASYYSVLEDTLIGFYLEPFSYSVRKRQNKGAKFYFFDTGIVRALSRLTNVPLTPQTHAYGNAFEHFIIAECMRLSSYKRSDFKFSYLRTPSDVEIDLIVERPGQPLLCIEIKSSTSVTEQMVSAFKNITVDMKNVEAVVLSQDKYAKKIGDVLVMPWRDGLREYFL